MTSSKEVLQLQGFVTLNNYFFKCAVKIKSQQSFFHRGCFQNIKYLLVNINKIKMLKERPVSHQVKFLLQFA